MSLKGIFFPHDINKSLLSIGDQSIEFSYKCDDRTDCNSYSIILGPGKYLLEAYGASGGGVITLARKINLPGCTNEDQVSLYKGNAICREIGSVAGAGGFSSGVISIHSPTQVYIAVGGAGDYGGNMVNGGFNGGGYGYAPSPHGAGSGGGATDFRLFSDSLFSRILVAGGGGGSDNGGGTYLGTDEGSGGAGGLPSQGLWLDGGYMAQYETNTTHGYSFGQGQMGNNIATTERAGAGGGFFGGFVMNHGNSGGGGGSSFALSDGIDIPLGNIAIVNTVGETLGVGTYNFTKRSVYKLGNVSFCSGIWFGNGMARITTIESYENEIYHSPMCPSVQYSRILFNLYSLFSIQIFF